MPIPDALVSPHLAFAVVPIYAGRQLRLYTQSPQSTKPIELMYNPGAEVKVGARRAGAARADAANRSGRPAARCRGPSSWRARSRPPPTTPAAASASACLCSRPATTSPSSATARPAAGGPRAQTCRPTRRAQGGGGRAAATGGGVGVRGADGRSWFGLGPRNGNARVLLCRRVAVSCGVV